MSGYIQKAWSGWVNKSRHPIASTVRKFQKANKIYKANKEKDKNGKRTK